MMGSTRSVSKSFSSALTLAALATYGLTASGTVQAEAQAENSPLIHGPAGHAPIGVMMDHMHSEGEWMVSYRQMQMNMQDMRDGTSRVDADDVTSGANAKMMGLDEMDMTMHMVGVMYAPTDQLTLALMGGYVTKEMDMVTGMGQERSQENSGVTDSKLTVMFRTDPNPSNALNWHMGLALNIPTGNVDETFNNMMGMDTKHGYPMQLGSGSWDFTPSVTVRGFGDAVSWGAQLNATVRTDNNSEGYRLGNRVDATGWVAYSVADWMSVSARVKGEAWGSIRGEDDDLNAMMSPGTDADLTGGERVWALAGVNWMVRDGQLAGHRLAIEYGEPVYEDLHGPQGSANWMATAGWQYAF